MKTTKQTLLIVITIFCLSLGLNAQKSTKLKVGDSAPGLQVDKWLRGEPIPEFKKEDERVYVVYLNGTWCPSCVKAIPHLTELQKKYNELITLISVYMGYGDSDEANIKRVINLMERLGDKMDFTIAVDNSRSNMITWRLRGPTMFIIRYGTIIWRGSSSGLNPVLEQFAKGSFDAMVARQEQQAYEEHLKNIRKAKTDGDFQSALTGIDRLIKEAEVYPGKLPSLYYMKFEILAGDDDKGAYEWLQWLMDNRVEGFIWDNEGMYIKISPENRNYKLELKAMDRAIEESETKDKMVHPLKLKAKIYDRMGNYKKAVETIRKAISIIEESGKINESYKNILMVYIYKARVREDSEKANAWLRREIENNKAEITGNLINAVKEVDDTFALELIDKASPEFDMGLYKYRILLRENSKKANIWLREELELDSPKVKITPGLVDAVTESSDPDYTFALELANQGLQNLSDKREMSNYHYMRGKYFGIKAAIYAATGNFTQAVAASEQAIYEYKELGFHTNVKELELLLAEYQSKL